MFFDWGVVAVTYTFKQLLIYTLVILLIFSFLLYGIWEIIRDNSRLRQENERLRKKAAQLLEDLARNKKQSHL